MAQLIAASVYGKNGNGWSSNNGVSMAFPSLGITAKPAPAGTTYAGVTCNAIIQVLPTGLNQAKEEYYTDKTVAQIVTAGNAPLA